MGRMREKNVVQRSLEAVSPTTTIQWDPITNDGTLRFNVEDIIIENEQVIGLTPNTELYLSGERTPIIERSISGLMSRSVEIPTGPDTSSTVPLMLVMGAIKVLFNELYIEAVELQNNPPAPLAQPEITFDRLPEHIRRRLVERLGQQPEE